MEPPSATIETVTTTIVTSTETEIITEPATTTTTPTTTPSTSAPAEQAESLRIALLGDVMLGRLVDQIFPSHNLDEEDRHHAIGLLCHRERAALDKV